jgi:hypothetical protein
LRGTAVEIGVHQGFFARQLLERWHGKTFVGIDPWCENIEGYGPDQTETLPDYDTGRGAFSHNPRVQDMLIACGKLDGFKTDVVLMRTTSRSAAHLLHDGLDMVYIDGNHESKYVREDLELWWPKIKVGGLCAGHDIWFTGADHFWRKVEPVVREFFKGRNGRIQLVPDQGVWSWYVEKALL